MPFFLLRKSYARVSIFPVRFPCYIERGSRFGESPNLSAHVETLGRVFFTTANPVVSDIFQRK